MLHPPTHGFRPSVQLSFLRSCMLLRWWSQGSSARDRWIPQRQLPAVCKGGSLSFAACRGLCSGAKTASTSKLYWKFKLWGTAWGCGSTWATATCDAHNDCQVSPAVVDLGYLGVQKHRHSALPHCTNHTVPKHWELILTKQYQMKPSWNEQGAAGNYWLYQAQQFWDHTLVPLLAGIMVLQHVKQEAPEPAVPWLENTTQYFAYCANCFSDAWSQPNLAAVCRKATKEDETDTVTKPTGSIADRLTARMEEALWLLWPGCDFNHW